MTMKTIKYMFLIVLWLFTMFAIAGESDTLSLGTVILIKAAGFGCGFLAWGLTNKWYSDGSLPGLSRFLEEDE